MEKLYYDRENKKFYVKELNIENNVVTDEHYVDVTDEMVELVQRYITKEGKQVLSVCGGYDTAMNNVIVELTQVELGDIINGLYYLKEKYYEDCKEHNGTATIGLSDEFKFYFKRFNEVLDLYARLRELEKKKDGTTTDS